MHRMPTIREHDRFRARKLLLLVAVQEDAKPQVFFPSFPVRNSLLETWESIPGLALPLCPSLGTHTPLLSRRQWMKKSLRWSNTEIPVWSIPSLLLSCSDSKWVDQCSIKSQKYCYLLFIFLLQKYWARKVAPDYCFASAYQTVSHRYSWLLNKQWQDFISWLNQLM